MAIQSPRTGLSVAFRPRIRTRSGSPTSPTYPLRKAGHTWPQSSTCAPARLSDGPCARPCTPSRPAAKPRWVYATHGQARRDRLQYIQGYIDPAACTLPRAISAQKKWSAGRLNPVHFSREDQNSTEITDVFSSTPNRPGAEVQRQSARAGRKWTASLKVPSGANLAKPRDTTVFPAPPGRQRVLWRGAMAEGVGFEPTVSFHPRRFSRPLP